MTTESLLDQLVTEFIEAQSRGDRPDPAGYAQRAGPAGARLSGVLGKLLVALPPSEPTSEQRAIVAMIDARVRARVERERASGPATLLGLRCAAGLARDAIVDAIVESFALGAERRSKVKRRYHELEAGLRPVGALDQRLIDLLGRLLGAGSDAIRAVATPPLVGAPVLARSESAFAADVPAAPVDSEPDVVDALFGAGSSGGV